MFKFVRFSMLFMALIIVPTALGQSSNGSISGTIVDQKDAVIAGATVTVRNVDTGFSRTATTGSDGRFRFGEIPIGGYELTVASTGFAKYVRTGIGLVVNQKPVLTLR